MRHCFFLLFGLIVGCLFFFGPPQFAQSTSRQPVETTIRKLSSAEFGGRVFKTESGRKAADYIAAQFREIGIKPVAGDNSYLQPIAGGGQNVVGVIPGRNSEFILVAAHYDAFGGAFVGAMDNGAGIAVMLETARLLAKTPSERSLLFIAFDGGEQRNAGAKFYAEHPLVPLEKTVAAINLSGFGGGMGDRLHETLYVIGAEFSPQLSQAVAKHKRSEANLALFGKDVMSFPGDEHFQFALKQIPTLNITNGVHYAYHSKFDTPTHINFAALEKHVATLAKVIREIANTPAIERASQPIYDADEANEWHRVLTALRENVIKIPANDGGLARLDDALFELKRFNGRPVQDVKARQAVVLRAASLCFYIANPNGVDFNTLETAARDHQQRSERAQAIAAYQKLLKLIDEEYRRDDQTVQRIKEQLVTLGVK